MPRKLSLQVAALQGQRDGAHMNAVELAGRVKFLLNLIDEGYTLRPEERKEILRSVARVGKRRIPTTKTIEARVERRTVKRMKQEHDFRDFQTKMQEDTEYLVEADSFAQQALWERWHDRYGVPWEQVGRGWGGTVGHIDKRPVAVMVFFAHIGGKLVGFWECTSQVADYVMAEEWLKETFPNVKRQTNADNFGNLLHDIADATGVETLIKNPPSLHPCPTCKRRY